MCLLLQQCCGQFALLDQLAKFLLAIPGIDLMGVVFFFFFWRMELFIKKFSAIKHLIVIIRADKHRLCVVYIDG